MKWLYFDLAIATDHAKIVHPEGRLGTFAPMAAVLAPSQEGRKETAKLLLTGDPIDAPEALNRIS